MNDEPEFTSDRLQDRISILKGVSIAATSFWWMGLFAAFSPFWWILLAGLLAGGGLTAKATMNAFGIELRQGAAEVDDDDSTDTV